MTPLSPKKPSQCSPTDKQVVTKPSQSVHKVVTNIYKNIYLLAFFGIFDHSKNVVKIYIKITQ